MSATGEPIDVLFIFTPKKAGCQAFNTYVELYTDMTEGERIVAAQDFLDNYISGGKHKYLEGLGVVCDSTDYYIDYSLSLD